MNFQLEIWRQDSRDAPGHFETKHVEDVDPEASFLEMLDTLNEDLVAKGGRTVAFGTGMRARKLGKGAMYLYGVRAGKVAWVGVTATSVATSPTAAKRYLKLAGLR